MKQEIIYKNRTIIEGTNGIFTAYYSNYSAHLTKDFKTLDAAKKQIDKWIKFSNGVDISKYETDFNEIDDRLALSVHNYTKELTVRQARKLLFDSEKYAIIQKVRILADTIPIIVHEEKTMTNKESRDYLYSLYNQEEKINVIDNGTHLLIWDF